MRSLVAAGSRLVSTLAVVACGSFAGDPGTVPAAEGGTDAALVDASIPETGPTDAPREGGACDPFAGFDTPVKLAPPFSDTMANTSSLRFSADGLSVFLARKNGVSFDLYRGTRAAPGATFNLNPITILNEDVYDENDPSVTGNGGLYFARRESSGPVGLFYAPLLSGGGYGGPVPLDLTPLGGVVLSPFVSADGQELYFTNVAVDADLWVAAGPQADGTFQAASKILLPANVPSQRDTPVLSADGLTLYFTAGKSDATAIWSVHRIAIGKAFENASQVGGLGPGPSGTFTKPSFVSADNCTITIISNRENTAVYAPYQAPRLR